MATAATRTLIGRVRFRPHIGFVAANTLFAAIFVALVLSMFHTPSPHDLPVGVVAPPAVTGQVEEALGRSDPGGFDLRVYPSEMAAKTAVVHGDVAGALIASTGHLQLLVGRGGGNAPAQTLATALGAAAAKARHSLTVTDVVPPLANDSMALSPFFVVLGVLFPSLAAGSASALVFRRAHLMWCVSAPVAAAVVIGLVTAGIADGISGLGNYAAVAGIIALFSAAVAVPTAALARTWPPLTAMAVLLFMMFGIPVSGGPSGLAAFGPGFLRVLHPALPLGAAASAMRGTVYFGGHGITGPLWALTAWAAGGIAALTLVTSWRRRTPDPQLAVADGTRDERPGGSRPTQVVSLVVGFDDSRPAQRALGWATGLFRARGDGGRPEPRGSGSGGGRGDHRRQVRYPVHLRAPPPGGTCPGHLDWNQCRGRRDGFRACHRGRPVRAHAASRHWIGAGSPTAALGLPGADHPVSPQASLRRAGRRAREDLPRGRPR